MAEEQHKRRTFVRTTAAAGTAAVVGGGLALVPAGVAGAATLTVTSAADSGPGTLRDLVATAVSGDTIQFDPSLVSITVGEEILIDKSLTISGPGANALTLNGGGDDRIFYAYNGASTIDVTISGVTLANGAMINGHGGIVYSEGENLTITASVISGGTTNESGGGISFRGLNGARLVLDDTVVEGNTAGIDGGGVEVFSLNGPSGGSVTVTDSRISGNTAGTDSGVDAQGGGMYVAAQYSVGGSMTIERTTISGNLADPDEFQGLGGGLYLKYVTTTIIDSTISGNTAFDGAGVGVAKYDLAVMNSTIANNTAYNMGGGIWAEDAGVELRQSTVGGNHAAAQGGGVFSNGPVVLRGSIVGTNTSIQNVDIDAPAVTADYSLIENDDVGAVGTGNVNADPLLGSLGGNGGPTETMLPASSSPAVNTGDPAYTAPPNTDQRGQPRVVNGRIDMGSVEVQPPPPPPEPPPTTTTTTPDEPPSEPVEEDVPPPAEPGGTSDVEVETEEGPVNIEVAGIEGDENVSIVVRTLDADDADVDTRGFAVQGRLFEIEVVGGSGNEGGTICLPYEPDPDAARDPYVVHYLDDGTTEVLAATVQGNQICATTSSFSPFAIAVFDTTRLAGADAAATAAAISASRFAPGVDVVHVVARARASDAIAAGPAGGPVLLVDHDAVPASTAAELERLDPASVVVVGGSDAVSDEVVEALGASRVAGVDRYETAADIATASFDTGVPVVYVVNGTSVPDGLVAASAAASEGGAVLLVTRDTVPDAAAVAIESLAPARVVVIGGTAAVSDAVAEALGATRIAGDDRYSTAAAVADAVGGAEVTVARGDDAADGLAGAPLGLPLLLVTRDEVPATTGQALTQMAPDAITVLGGTAAVSLDTELDLARYLEAQ